MASTQKSGSLKEELTCSVCCELYADRDGNRPILLLCCQNVFCQRCIENVTSCPQCRKLISQTGQRPCRVLLKILECLCIFCLRHEKEKNCVHCNMGLCHSCMPEHVVSHDTDIAMKERELKDVMKAAQDFIDTIKDGLEGVKTKIYDRELALIEGNTDDSLKYTEAVKLSRESSVEEKAELAHNIEQRYREKMSHQRRVRKHITNHILPLLVNIACQLDLSVPDEISNFDRKPLFQSVASISNIDIAVPGDQLTYIAAETKDRVLSQITGQQCVDQRHLVSSSTPHFHLMPEENATCSRKYKNYVLVGTDASRVVVCRDQTLEHMLPAIGLNNRDAICGVAVTTAVDGTEMVLAVDGSENVYRHILRTNEGLWDAFFVSNEDIEFVDIFCRDDIIYLASSDRITLVSRVAEQEMKRVILFQPERSPVQMIIVNDNCALLRMDGQRKLYVKSLTEPKDATTIDFSFDVHHVQFDGERRLLYLIGYHSGMDHYALHTFTV